MSMRGIDTEVRKVRRRIFTEVANLAYDSENLKDDMEALPYALVREEDIPDYGSMYRKRAIVRERIRLALGLSLRPENVPVHLTQGLEESNIDEKYYEPPLMQVIPSACNACPENMYKVTDRCMGCTAHPCQEVCPRGAISFRDGVSYIDQEKCIKCGKCKAICPYDAISHQVRPCLAACGVAAIKSDEKGRAYIDADTCVSCGQCMLSCPFGAIADKSQIFQLIRALQSDKDVIAQVAPSFAGQFGKDVSGDMLKEALLKLGFKDVYETAAGADLGCVTEAKHYHEEVATGKQAFALTSCCPSWSVLARKFFPETIDKISNALTPMVATARIIKQDHPEAKVVFIGPCASKKLEAMRRTVRSDVDFVITFEELQGIFESRGINFETLKTDASLNGNVLKGATGAGRGYGVAGGVAEAIEKCIHEFYPDTEVHIEHAEGLSECKKMLMLAKAGKKNGCLIEGMACPGGCIAGAGTNLDLGVARNAMSGYVSDAAKELPDYENRQESMDEL